MACQFSVLVSSNWTSCVTPGRFCYYTYTQERWGGGAGGPATGEGGRAVPLQERWGARYRRGGGAGGPATGEVGGPATGEVGGARYRRGGGPATGEVGGRAVPLQER